MLYPPTCVGCGMRGYRFCPRCTAQVKTLGNNVCQICGEPGIYDDFCKRCSDHTPAFHAIRSWGIYEEPLNRAIQALKYKRNLPLGYIFASNLVPIYKDQGWSLNLVVPVPLSKRRKRERGFNQSEYIAQPLARQLGITYRPNALVRLRDTKSQVGLSLTERRTNVQNAFKADSRLVTGNSILVVDDVATSGATLDACAEALLDAGAAVVYGLTVARAAHTMSY